MKFGNPAPVPATLTGGTITSISQPVGVAGQPLTALTQDVPVTAAFGPLDDGGSSGIYDTRPYQSFILVWDWNVLDAANLSAFGQLHLYWFDVPFGTYLGQDLYEIGCNFNIVPGNLGTTKLGIVRGPCKGGALQMQFFGAPVPPGGAGRISASGQLVLSYRQNPVERWYTDDAGGRVLGYATVNGLPASTVSSPVLFAPYDGVVELHCWAAGTSNTNSHIRIGWGSLSWAHEIGTAFPAQDVLYLPNNAFGAFANRQVSSASRLPLYFRFFNGDTIARSMSVWATCDTMA